MIFNKKEDLIKYLDIAFKSCEKHKVIDTEEILYETNEYINEYNKSNEVKFTCNILEYIVDTIRDVLSYKGYYIRSTSEFDWKLCSFGTAFFSYKDKEMWITTMVGQGSLDFIGFNHEGLSDEFELWKKTNLLKKNLFPKLEDAIDEYYEERMRKHDDQMSTSA